MRRTTSFKLTDCWRSYASLPRGAAGVFQGRRRLPTKASSKIGYGSTNPRGASLASWALITFTLVPTISQNISRRVCLCGKTFGHYCDHGNGAVLDMTEVRIKERKPGEDEIAGDGRTLSTWRTCLFVSAVLTEKRAKEGCKPEGTGVDVKPLIEAISESQESANDHKDAAHGVSATGFCRWGRQC